MVTKEALLARAQEGRVKSFSVDGMDMFARRLGLDERIAIGDRARAGEKIGSHEYLAMCLCHEDGSPVFTAEEAKVFCDSDGELAERILEPAMNLAGLVPKENVAKN